MANPNEYGTPHSTGRALLTVGVPVALLLAGAAVAASALTGDDTHEVTIPAGTVFVAALSGPVSTESHHAGDPINLEVPEAVRLEGGEVIPAGTRIQGEVVHSRDGGRMSGAPELVFRFSTMEVEGESYVIEAAPFRLRGRDDAGETAGMIAGGAAAGAIVGAVTGGDAGDAVAGAIVGSAIGTGVAIATDGDHLRLAAGQALRIRLAAPVTLKLPNPPDDATR